MPRRFPIAVPSEAQSNPLTNVFAKVIAEFIVLEIAVPIFFQRSSVCRAALIASTMPCANPFAVLFIRVQSRVSNAPMIRFAMAVPRLLQWKFSTNESTNSNAELIACAMVTPISVNNPGVSRKPFRNVAILLAIFLSVALIPSHGMFSRASFSFSPNILPISVKSASAHASLTISARSLYLSATASVSYPLPSAPLLLPLPLLSSLRILSSSMPVVRFFAAFAALFKESV